MPTKLFPWNWFSDFIFFIFEMILTYHVLAHKLENTLTNFPLENVHTDISTNFDTSHY